MRLGSDGRIREGRDELGRSLGERTIFVDFHLGRCLMMEGVRIIQGSQLWLVVIDWKFDRCHIRNGIRIGSGEGHMTIVRLKDEKGRMYAVFK